MLRSLHVKNLALIDEIEIDFSNGLNILSGETGAGKSIIIGSINLALGEKIQKDLLRDNENPALVELIFEIKDDKLKEALAKMDIYPEDGLLILTRKILNGRGVAKINAETVPVLVLKKVASLLIDIHGQHEHQSLLSKKKHLEILDDYAKESIETLKADVLAIYHTYKELKEQIANSTMDEEQRTRELSFLEYECEEITNANLLENEDEELEQQYKRFINSKKIAESLNHAYNFTKDDNDGASELTTRALKELTLVEDFDPDIKKLSSTLLEIDNILNDFNRELADYMQGLEFDEEDFIQIENRLDEVNRLKVKYGKSINEILSSLEEKQNRIIQLKDYDLYIKNLQNQLNENEKQLEAASEKLSKRRQQFAKKMVEHVKQSLVDLNFLDVKFEMKFKKLQDFTANGFDEAEFLISTNPGEPIKPLKSVASGGELSRIMLAIKAVLAHNDDIGTLIFDEIDSGISGRTAQMVSEKMNVIGKEHQIISITHLPQIAAMADTHFLIEKAVEHKVTVSRIRKLDFKESIQELGRMIGGVKITDTVLQSAQEMKNMAQSIKNI